MIKAVNIAQELDRLVFLEGRCKETSIQEAAAAFATLAAYRDGGVFAGGFSGESPWERHPNGDELVHILKGSTNITIISEQGPESFELDAGMMIVVPQACWHRFNSPQGVTVLTVTPQPTEHSEVVDPTATGY